ncbi:MAG: autotransporter outer membrane beta-barrel domain-containing protein [Verrucomicrobiales bacterium]|jgi:outer membrane autotransporter protein|nr:autotransporter outer membrane beta-barrel domain-containing protein [Verrucomicrobiales bacterium]
MKTNTSIKTLAAMLIVSGLNLTTPLTVSAAPQVKYNDQSTHQSDGALQIVTTAGGNNSNFTADQGSGLRIENIGTVYTLDDGSTIQTSGNYAHGAYAMNGGVIHLGADQAVTVAGNYAYAVYANNALIVIDSGTFAGTGAASSGVQANSGTIQVGTAWITTTGSSSAYAVVAHAGGLVDLGTHSMITSASSSAIRVGNGGGEVRATRATISAPSGGIATLTDGGVLRLTDSNLSGRSGIGFGLNPGFEPGPVTAAYLSGGVIDVETTAFNLYHLEGGSTVKGLLNVEGTVVRSGTLLNVAAESDFTANLTDTDLTEAGGINIGAGNHGTTTVNLNGGSGVTGDVTNSGSGALGLNLDHSTLTGDVTNAGDGVLVVTLDNNSIGTGGYHGGNLITGSDSTWTFNKDSHGNYGENHGVWNIGDYEVIFDNMLHTGTVNLSVNSDTGEGGSITVTDTADGDGTVHIDTTGNGQADPNKVLPGKVTGDGTENWQWDPIDWGIDTIIKDGDHFIKQGTSPAGAVLNSSVAIQQAMWFAQQNSLLKRMGELRHGARASRPLADKDVRVPYNSLIENIWLRSYGQQLNIGSQVAGKAYEQLIYGVDLGTDHKFTISADSDLYLGVYAGYGRSDLDYRTPGADGEINSYYGGLYATWLHSSGFYIDATFKAASVDNDLKAPYSGSQINANYSDINIGGSIEIGKKFTFSDDWFIEPQFQVNYLHILTENYQAGPMTISAQDLDALQFRIGSLFGRTINLTNSGALQPYVKISGVETISSGGTLRNGYQHIRANTDGARAEVGAGLIWQLDADNQLHLDYEASFGDKYDKPWGLTAGYRHQF